MRHALGMTFPPPKRISLAGESQAHDGWQSEMAMRDGLTHNRKEEEHRVIGGGGDKTWKYVLEENRGDKGQK